MTAENKISRDKPQLRLRVTAAAETVLRAGHPWLFAESIREQNRQGSLGELAVIFDRKDKFLAVGLFDPDSPIRVRVLHAGKPQPIDAVWWQARLEGAMRRRRRLFDERTTGFRWLNGESDGWPGLVLDRYGDTLVMKLYTGAWLPRLRETVSRFQNALQPNRVVLRLSRNIQEKAKALFGKGDGEILIGPSLNGPVVFDETGLKFEADVLRGQKTGFFLDQRENRRRVEPLAQGRTMLNAFSFSGGFSVYAARGGARVVTDLDISSHALESAKRNFALNQDVAAVAECTHELLKSDTFEWLAGNANRQFDVIVLDPPSLAKREADRERAVKAYRTLVSLAVRHLSRGGILLACSCSAHVTADEFFAAVTDAVVNSKRKFVELERTGHAPDHPAAFKEAAYLKAIFIRMRS
jgi:23S rRNA (cytosine1962-C5)-methyltransferase